MTGDRPLLPSHDLAARVAEAVAAIRARTPLVPRIALTLGSGLGRVIDALENAVGFPTAELPHWPPSTVIGHAGRVALGNWRGTPVVMLAGRSHRYEGYALDRVTFGVRVMHALGARTLLFTNAVGALRPGIAPGDVMLATDHINFIGKRGLFAPQELRERRLGRRVASPYSPRLQAALSAAAARAGVALRRGTLMGSHGPTYETAAEVQMAIALGADVACMSTVHEVTVAAELGGEVASLSCVTNRATGLSNVPLTHAEVTEVANRVATRLQAILEEFLASEHGGAPIAG
ncbi:MAG TPA: purine-nucleoside phosphorylase [Candidatus Limnocylindria bacterium]|nr:purine-nucleoside phosphorylase [Candidatus Limnocylindria bacterium]